MARAALFGERVRRDLIHREQIRHAVLMAELLDHRRRLAAMMRLMVEQMRGLRKKPNKRRRLLKTLQFSLSMNGDRLPLSFTNVDEERHEHEKK
jgi:hypothetical protein